MPSPCTIDSRSYERVVRTCTTGMYEAYIPASGTTRSSSALIGIGLADRGDLKSVHADFRVINFQLRISGIDDIEDTIDCMEMT
jgi:hypothetical protein